MRSRETLIALVASGLASCASVPEAEDGSGLGWMTGCWETQGGDYREVWRAEGGHLFGFAVAYTHGAEVFFEQTRIDLSAPAVFNAYPAGKGPSAFAEIERSAAGIVFQNTAHDYPQTIAYARDGAGLKAAVSLADGSKASHFAFRRCAR